MSTATRVLICAATGVEARACRQGVRGGFPEICFEVLQTGIGPAAAAQSLRARLERARPRPQLVISSGFAGALHERFSVGAWALADSISAGEEDSVQIQPFLRDALERRTLQWQTGGFFSTAQVIAREERSDLSPYGSADVIDMESWALHKVATDAGIPFQALRMITDTPVLPIPRAIGTWATAANRLTWLRGLGQAARHPIEMAKFIARASLFPRLLSEGWREVVVGWRAVRLNPQRRAG